MITRIILGLTFVALATVIPFYFDQLLFSLVEKLHLGWVLGTILIRLLVIILFFSGVRQFFKLSERLARIKAWVLFLILLLPGFGVSFIAPIYTVDYGDLRDDFSLASPENLQDTLHTTLIPDSGHALVAFFTSTCPHCMAASTKLGLNIEAGQKIPVNVIFPGTEEDAMFFLERNRGQKFNHYLLTDDAYFVELSGGVFPSVFLLDSQGSTIAHWTGDQLNYTALDYLSSIEQ